MKNILLDSGTVL